MEEASKRRRGSAGAKIKQLDWIMQFVIRTQPCAICGGSLAEGYNARYPGKSITLHHGLGHREIDEWENLEYVANMVLCHSTCHKRYHLVKRHTENGKRTNVAILQTWENNIANTIRKQLHSTSTIVV